MSAPSNQPNKPTETVEAAAVPIPPGAQTIVIQQPPPRSTGKWFLRVLVAALVLSILVNISFYAQYKDYFSETEPPIEKFHSGDKSANSKIALLEMTGTIMPPFTERFLNSIKRAREDDAVVAAILVIDSPGGTVADSHQIFHALQQLRKEKPMAVVMKRMAASGGYYIAMGAGPEATIYAEPTCWTGSIGVILPRYNAKVLAEEKLGVQSEPIKTGKFKDSLNPFRDLSVEERTLWEELIADAFDRFQQVIADNRTQLSRRSKNPMLPPEKTVEHYATGRIFTASQAKTAGLIDEIGYLDDAIAAMKQQLGRDDLRVITYKYPLGLFGLLTGAAQARQPDRQWEALRSLAVPQPMYYCGGIPLIPAARP